MSQPEDLPKRFPGIPWTVYWENRNSIPKDELAKHRGKWVAFSADGSRIVASCDTLDGLDDGVRAAGEDPEAVVYDSPSDAGDIFPGGSQFQVQ